MFRADDLRKDISPSVKQYSSSNFVDLFFHDFFDLLSGKKE